MLSPGGFVPRGRVEAAGGHEAIAREKIRVAPRDRHHRLEVEVPVPALRERPELLVVAEMTRCDLGSDLEGGIG